MAVVRDFRDLVVWQRAMELACEVPLIIARLPGQEKYVLGNQMGRAVLSIPANIAEGCGRRSRAEYLRFLSIANGSLRELHTLLLLAQRRELVTSATLTRTLALADEIARMLTVLNRVLRAKK
jgi:four helix bundle protein